MTLRRRDGSTVLADDPRGENEPRVAVKQAERRPMVATTPAR